jgi:chitinase
MVWALDQKDQSASNGAGIDGVSADQQSNAKQLSADQAAKLSCYSTDCNAKCKKGTNQVAQMNGQPGQLSTRCVLNGPEDPSRVLTGTGVCSGHCIC